VDEPPSVIIGYNWFPLRQIGALSVWGFYGNPRPEAWKSTCWWVAGLCEAPWQAPSVPIPELSSQPNYEVREANLDCGVWVLYQHSYEEHWTDLLAVA
jgi:hypothetical protein